MPSGDGIQSVRTAFRIVREIRASEGAVGVSELARRLDLPVSTVHSHLSTLHDCEYLVKRDGGYGIGYRFLEDGGGRRHRSRFYEFARPKADQLATEVGDKVSVVVADHGLAAHIYIAKGAEAIRTDLHTGIRLPAHASAGGKAILATMDEERVAETLDRRGLPACGPNTITERGALLEELETVRETGVAFEDEERVEGLRGVAASLPRTDGKPNAAISVTAPVSRLQDERFEETVAERVRNVAETIRIKLRYA